MVKRRSNKFNGSPSTVEKNQTALTALSKRQERRVREMVNAYRENLNDMWNSLVRDSSSIRLFNTAIGYDVGVNSPQKVEKTPKIHGMDSSNGFNNRQLKVLNDYFELFPDTFQYRFGEGSILFGKHSLKRTDLSDEFKQSITQHCFNRLPKQPPKSKTQSNEEVNIDRELSGDYDFFKTRKKLTDEESNKLKIEKVKKYLLKQFNVIKPIREKLHYPSVFKALNSTPHLALEQTRKVLDEFVDGVLIVDENITYFDEAKADFSLPDAFIKAGKSLKNLQIVKHRLGDYDTFQKLLKQNSVKLTPETKILVFTQGCGSINKNYYNGVNIDNIKIVTIFNLHRHCGCNTINISHNANINMVYNVTDVEKLPT